MAWIYIEKRYKYSKSINSVVIKVEFIWDVRWREALIVIEADNQLYELNYDPFNYINSARVFLKTVNQLENTHTLEELNDFLSKLS